MTGAPTPKAPKSALHEAFDLVRVDRSARTTRTLVLGASLVALGGSALGAAFAHRLGAGAALGGALSGAVLLFVGLLVGFGTMVATLLENAYLGLREDGIVLHDDRGELLIAWDEVARVEHRRGAIVITEHGGREQIFYAGNASEAVAARIELVRRRASLGMVGARLRA